MKEVLKIPLKATLYRHQQSACRFACERFGILPSETHSNGVQRQLFLLQAVQEDSTIRDSRLQITTVQLLTDLYLATEPEQSSFMLILSSIIRQVQLILSRFLALSLQRRFVLSELSS